MTDLTKPIMEHPDPYVKAAARLYSIDPSEVSPEQRKKAKEIAYMLAYGTPSDRIPR